MIYDAVGHNSSDGRLKITAVTFHFNYISSTLGYCGGTESNYTAGGVGVNAGECTIAWHPPPSSFPLALCALSSSSCAPPGLPPISRSPVSESGTARGQRDNHNTAAAALPNTSHQYCRRALNNLLLAWIHTVAGYHGKVPPVSAWDEPGSSTWISCAPHLRSCVSVFCFFFLSFFCLHLAACRSV